jgi:thioredoxin 1
MTNIIDINSDNFDAEVTNSDTPVLLDFWASWCAPCKMIAPLLDKVAADRSDIKIAKVNVEDEPGIASRFAIRSIPTLLVIKSGYPSATKIGAVTSHSALNTFIDSGL